MPVYEQTYKHYEGEYRPANTAWMVIAWSGIVRFWRSKGIRFLLFFSLALFFVNIGRLYLASNLEALTYFGFNNPQFQDFIQINDEFYRTFLSRQTFFCFLVTLFIGSSQIALDRRRKTLILYLSKPLGKLDYLFGKGIIVFFYLCVVTVIPALLLMFLHAMFTDDWMYLVNNLDLMMRIITLSMVMVVPLTIVILMLSALSKSTETTAVMFCLVFYIPYNLGNILRPLIRSSESYWVKEGWKLISLRDIADELGKTLFQIESGIHIHWSAFLIALVAICLLAGWICYRRIQAVEVVN